MGPRLGGIRFTDVSEGLDWDRIKSDLAADDFDNGRTADQLARSFRNSYSACYALDGERCVGMARLLADGVCNAYLVDVWTLSSHRNRGIGTEMVERLTAAVPGHHVGLFTEIAEGFYRRLGFEREDVGMSAIVGEWLRS